MHRWVLRKFKLLFTKDYLPTSIILNSGINIDIQGRWWLKLTFELRQTDPEKITSLCTPMGVSLVMIELGEVN